MSSSQFWMAGMSQDSNGIGFFTNLLIVVSSFCIAYASFEPVKLLGVQAAAKLAYPVYLSFTLDPYAVYDALLLKVAEKSVKRPRGRWRPALRSFAKCRRLFLCRSGHHFAGSSGYKTSARSGFETFVVPFSSLHYIDIRCLIPLYIDYRYCQACFSLD